MDILIAVLLSFIVYLLIPTKKQYKPDSYQQKPKVDSIVDHLEFTKIDTLYTQTELPFHHVLKEAINNQYDINAKVRLADIVKIAADSHTDWQTGFDMIKDKHIDFVLSDKETSEIICCVELDDKAHESKRKMKRDMFVRQTLQNANVPLIKFHAQFDYDPIRVKNSLMSALPHITIADNDNQSFISKSFQVARS